MRMTRSADTISRVRVTLIVTRCKYRRLRIYACACVEVFVAWRSRNVRHMFAEPKPRGVDSRDNNAKQRSYRQRAHH